jgi:hypothetical protein
VHHVLTLPSRAEPYLPESALSQPENLTRRARLYLPFWPQPGLSSFSNPLTAFVGPHQTLSTPCLNQQSHDQKSLTVSNVFPLSRRFFVCTFANSAAPHTHQPGPVAHSSSIQQHLRRRASSRDGLRSGDGQVDKITTMALVVRPLHQWPLVARAPTPHRPPGAAASL